MRGVGWKAGAGSTSAIGSDHLARTVARPPNLCPSPPSACARPSVARDTPAAPAASGSPPRAARSPPPPPAPPRPAAARRLDQRDIAARRQRRGGDVYFGPHQDRRLARQHVADDAADARGHHPHQRGGHRRDAVAERLRRAEHRIGGEPDRVEPVERRARATSARASPRSAARPPGTPPPRGVVDPEHRRADQQVAHRPAADPGDRARRRRA